PFCEFWEQKKTTVSVVFATLPVHVVGSSIMLNASLKTKHAFQETNEVWPSRLPKPRLQTSSSFSPAERRVRQSRNCSLVIPLPFPQAHPTWPSRSSRCNSCELARVSR